MHPAPNLTTAVAEWTRRGWTVEQMTPTTAVLMTRGPNHLGHFIATLFTCGLWLPLWFYVAATQRERRVVLGVDDQGQVYQASGA